MKSVSGTVAALGVATALILRVPGCGGGATPPPPHPAASTPIAEVATVTGCSAPAGYASDAAHSGRLTAHNYSAAADVQAALEYDQLQAGARDVYVRRVDGEARNVASCVAMRFPSPHLAGRFFMSYRALRREAGSLVDRIQVPGGGAGLSGATGYLEKKQSFRGYGIASTDVVELSGRDGSRLDIVSVSGSTPSRTLAKQLFSAMAGER